MSLPGDEPTEEVKCEDLEVVAISVDMEKFFQVDSKLPPLEKEELIKFLRDACEAPGVDPNFI